MISNSLIIFIENLYQNLTEIANSMDWTEIFTAFGTIASSFIALFTLLQLKKQVNESYKPNLLCRSIYALHHHIGDPSWRSSINPLMERASEIDTSTSRTEIVKFYVANVGKGPAIDVEICWNWSIEAFVDCINSYSNHRASIDNASVNISFNGQDIIYIRPIHSTEKDFVNTF